MAVPRTIGCTIFLVAIFCLHKKGYGESEKRVLEEVMDTKQSVIHGRHKRAVTIQSTTAQNFPVDFDAVVKVQIPVSSAPFNISEIVRDALKNLSFTFNQSLIVTSLNLTTECYPNTTGELQCQCERQFSWPCSKCQVYDACSNNASQPCECSDALPYDGQFCEPYTNAGACLASTTATPPSSTKTEAPPSSTTTAAPPSTPLASTTIAEPPSSTTTAAPPSTALSSTTTVNLSFTMDLPFSDSYNNGNSSQWTDISSAIQTQCRNHISNLINATLTGFRRGSTIADYTVNAPSLNITELDAVKTGIFTDLGTKYPIIFDSSANLSFTHQSAFYGQTVNVTCGPLPKSLNFGNNWIAEWSQGNSLISNDSKHSLSTDYGAGTATLTMSNVFTSEDGLYECNFKQATGGPSFRQKSSVAFKVTEVPLVQVSPVQIKVPCDGRKVQLTCSVSSNSQNYLVEFTGLTNPDVKINYEYTNTDCTSKTFTCQVKDFPQFNNTITLTSFTGSFLCQDSIFGFGQEDDTAAASCPTNQEGIITAICKKAGWQEQLKTCVLKPVTDLLVQSQFLTTITVPTLLSQLSNVSLNYTKEVVGSPTTISAVVQILSNVANALLSLSIPITKSLMEDVLITSGILTTAKDSWKTLNNGSSSLTNSSISKNESISSKFLQSIEQITRRLTNDSFDISTDYIIFNKTTFKDNFNAEFNSSVDVAISEATGENKSLTIITFSLMDSVLPARNELNLDSAVINGKVVLIQSSANVSNISLTFVVTNDSLKNPECVFWNFNLSRGLGGWDNTGCKLVNNNQTVTCNCNHLTSFSILMSPFSIEDPVLDYITYIGVSISMASLIICLIIEAVIWRKIKLNHTSYLRHVSIVNIAVSLLIADIWFIIGAAISAAKEENKAACSTATFFIHYFYLALFFWMLASALLLLYRTVSVFDGGLSKTSMLVIGFSLGYGAPLIIVVVTIAAAAPRQAYIQGAKICWLNWNESKALLAFVIPALTIVVINLIILLVVLYKMLRRRAVGGASHALERHITVVLARTLAVLTPFFGITWGLGIGTMIHPHNRGLLIAFALFNSLQGFFILVFGTLLDHKVQSELVIKSQTSSRRTKSTSAGALSSSGLGAFWNWRRARDGYSVSSGATNASNSYSNS
ncbi:adhesion G protein-coupled receptor F5-like isoform X5 [Anabas testudineus]|uniref:adhesion G protein-coupled receptor F5-like isoform X5 n=1 Tax=Anabas testudineus TaxID=64144 RepID=UPI000E454657|nr:adhesion G protein-coupled receptor F5-like isoform X5 [Anabas testudineus]